MKRTLAMIYSWLLVGIQLTALAYLAVSGPLFARDLPLFLLQLTGVFIGLAAVWRMAGTRWRIRPDVHPKARLITRGIYRRIRHPMYTAVLLIALSWLYLRFTGERAIAFGVLFATLCLKLAYEERLLHHRFGKAYAQYCQHSYRLIPHIF